MTPKTKRATPSKHHSQQKNLVGLNTSQPYVASADAHSKELLKSTKNYQNSSSKEAEQEFEWAIKEQDRCRINEYIAKKIQEAKAQYYKDVEIMIKTERQLSREDTIRRVNEIHSELMYAIFSEKEFPYIKLNAKQRQEIMNLVVKEFEQKIKEMGK